MGGQKHRLVTPNGVLDPITEILNRAATDLAIKCGTHNFFAAFDFGVKHMRFSTSAAMPSRVENPLALANLAMREAITQQELSFVAGERNAVTNDSYTTPTNLIEDIDNPLLFNCIRANDPTDHWKYSLAHTMLLMGDYNQGGEYYRARPVRRTPSPVVNSNYVHGEQGLGDELFFMRYATQLTTAWLNPKIAPMLNRNGFDVLSENNRTIPDVAIPIGDLFCEAGYVAPSIKLTPSNEMIQTVRDDLDQYPRPWIAITLQGGIDPAQQTSGLWSQYKEYPNHSKIFGRASYPAGTILDTAFNPKIKNNLEYALAFLSQMDHYISVPNTNVHLREALGKPTHVLIPWVPEWRWGLKDKSPFFPLCETYRQSPDGSWTKADEKLSATLARLELI